MATFTNQATLTYNGSTVVSNVAVGEYRAALDVAKAASGTTYVPGEPVTYVVSLRNTGETALTGFTVTDNLGAYTLTSGTTVYPLSYVAGSVMLYQNGVLQSAPTVTAGPPLVFSGITVPAGGDVVLVYRATPNTYAAPTAGGTLVNTVTVTGTATESATATATVTVTAVPNLTVSKSVEPIPVTAGGTLTYTIVIRNYGNTAADATDNISVTDTFDPVLSNLTATLNGTALTAGTDYTYTNGTFTTTPGRITVPAATFTQNPTTGIYTTVPGTATLVITGTV